MDKLNNLKSINPRVIHTNNEQTKKKGRLFETESKLLDGFHLSLKATSVGIKQRKKIK